MREIKQNTDDNIKLFLTDETDHITGITGLSASLTAELCKDDDTSFSSITVAASGSEIGYGWYNVVLTDSNGHTNTIGDLIVRLTATGADSAERLMSVVENIESDTFDSTQAIESTLDGISGDIQDLDLELDGLATESTLESISGDINTIKGTGYDVDIHSLTEIKNRIG